MHVMRFGRKRENRINSVTDCVLHDSNFRQMASEMKSDFIKERAFSVLGEAPPSSLRSKISSEGRAWRLAWLNGSISVGQKWDCVDPEEHIEARGYASCRWDWPAEPRRFPLLLIPLLLAYCWRLGGRWVTSSSLS